MESKAAQSSVINQCCCQVENSTVAKYKTVDNVSVQTLKCPHNGISRCFYTFLYNFSKNYSYSFRSVLMRETVRKFV